MAFYQFTFVNINGGLRFFFAGLFCVLGIFERNICIVFDYFVSLHRVRMEGMKFRPLFALSVRHQRQVLRAGSREFGARSLFINLKSQEYESYNQF